MLLGEPGHVAIRRAGSLAFLSSFLLCTSPSWPPFQKHIQADTDTHLCSLFEHAHRCRSPCDEMHLQAKYWDEKALSGLRESSLRITRCPQA